MPAGLLLVHEQPPVPSGQPKRSSDLKFGLGRAGPADEDDGMFTGTDHADESCTVAVVGVHATRVLEPPDEAGAHGAEAVDAAIVSDEVGADEDGGRPHPERRLDGGVLRRAVEQHVGDELVAALDKRLSRVGHLHVVLHHQRRHRLDQLQRLALDRRLPPRTTARRFRPGTAPCRR